MVNNKIDFSHMTNWQVVDLFPKPSDTEVILVHYEKFKGSMVFFHILRKIAIFFDRCGNKTRGIISHFTETYDIENGMKLPKDYFNL